MTTGKIKVLYVAAWARSGTTILNSILGELEGFFAAGEIYHIWQRGLIDAKMCGCGKPIPSCEVWGEVIRQNRGWIEQIDKQHLIELSRSINSHETMLSRLPGGKPYLERKVAHYASYVEQLYSGIQSVSGCKVLVDTSGSPAHGYILSTLPEIDLYVLHVVRDPRAVAYSHLRKVAYDIGSDSELMEQRRPMYIALGWAAWNTEIEQLWGRGPHYMFKRYEDFIQSPRETVRSVVEFCGEPAVDLPFLSENEVSLHPNHILSGNPSRFKTGSVKLALDNEWETGMRPSSKALVTALTAPSMHHYGYI